MIPHRHGSPSHSSLTRCPRSACHLSPSRRTHGLSYKYVESKRDSLGWNAEFATAFLADHIEHISEPHLLFARVIEEAGARLSQLAHSVERIEFFLREFATIFNRYFFDKKLADRVVVRIRDDLPEMRFSGRVLVEQSVVAIDLNPRVSDSVPDLLAAVIHYMIHAYFMVACGTDNLELENDQHHWPLKDGQHFAVIFYKFASLIGATHSKEPIPLCMDHEVRHRGPPQPRHWVGPSAHDDFSNANALVPHRTRQTPRIIQLKSRPRKEDVEEWYKTNCQPLLGLPKCAHEQFVHRFGFDFEKLERVPRTEIGGPEKYIELIWNQKCFVVMRDQLNNHPSFAEYFVREKTRWLAMPECTSLSLFTAFCRYIESPLSVLSKPFSSIDAGQSLIQATELYNLSTQVPDTYHTFKDLSRNILAYLDTLIPIISLTDAVGAIAAIYISNPLAPSVSPPQELREWVVRYLSAPSVSSTMSSPVSSLHSPTNIASLDATTSPACYALLNNPTFFEDASRAYVAVEVMPQLRNGTQPQLNRTNALFDQACYWKPAEPFLNRMGNANEEATRKWWDEWAVRQGLLGTRNERPENPRPRTPPPPFPTWYGWKGNEWINFTGLSDYDKIRHWEKVTGKGYDDTLFRGAGVRGFGHGLA